MADLSAFFSILPKLGSAIEAGASAYGAAKAAGLPVTPDLVGSAVSAHLTGWNPLIRGKIILDDDTRIAMCRFLAGVAFNLSK